MPIQTENLNKKLYDLLKSQGYNPVPKDSEGQTTPVPDEAEVFQFTFSMDGKDYGKVWITIDSSQNLIIYYDDKVTNSDDEGGGRNWTRFLQQLKAWAQRRQLSFELKNQNHLASDMAQRSHMKKKEQIAEGYHPMGKSASYNDNIPTVKIVLQHTRQIQEGEQRYRNIAKIFLENQQGERILCPSTKPGIAQIYARHLAEGGLPHDERWNHIGSLVEEYSRMAGFVRATRSGQFNESAQQLVNEGINHYNSLRETLGKMRGHRGYQAYFESYTPALMETDGDESINELFVQETLDPRIESVMPILAKLHKKVNEMSEVSELAEWADKIVEGDGGQEALNPVGIPEEDLTEEVGDVRDAEDFKERIKNIKKMQMTQRADPTRRLAKLKQELIRKAKEKGIDTSSEELEEDGEAAQPELMPVLSRTQIGLIRKLRAAISYDDQPSVRNKPRFTPEEVKELDDIMDLAAPSDAIGYDILKRAVSGGGRYFKASERPAVEKLFKELLSGPINKGGGTVNAPMPGGDMDQDAFQQGFNQAFQQGTAPAQSAGTPPPAPGTPPPAPSANRAVQPAKPAPSGTMSNPMRSPGKFMGPAVMAMPRLKEEDLEEDLGPEQKAVGQLGPTEKVKNNNIGKLVGENLEESHMSNVDLIMQGLGSGERDIYDTMNHPKTPDEQYAAGILQDMYDDVAANSGLHPDDDFEQIIDIMADNIASDYPSDEVDEGKWTVNAKTGAKLDPRTGRELPPKEKPMTIKQFLAPKAKSPAAPKLTLSDVWRKVEEVVGQIYPDGDPIDWLGPWFRKQGIEDHKVGDILTRAAKKNGYKDIYDYYNHFADDLGEGWTSPNSPDNHVPDYEPQKGWTNPKIAEGQEDLDAILRIIRK